MDHRVEHTAAALDSFLLRLNDVGAVKIDTKVGFKLKLHESNPDAPLSPLYFNLRLADNKQGPLGYGDVQQMAEFMFTYAVNRELKFDGLCGIPRAGEPFAEEMQRCYDSHQKKVVPRITLDKYDGDKVRSIGNVISQGGLQPGSRILLLDDLITRADSKIEAINRLREAGYVVEDTLVFLDREQGGGRQLGYEHGVKLHSIIGVTSALRIFVDANRITPEQHAKILQYLNST